MKSPIALAACGAFLVPEPLGTCFVVVAAIWWLCRKIGSPLRTLLSGINMLYHGNRLDMVKEVSDGSVDLRSFSLHDAHETDTVIGETGSQHDAAV